MDMPPFYSIRQDFDTTSLADVAAAVRDEFSKFDPADKIRPGQTVAVGVASRGTHDLKILVTATVACLKSMGLKPFVIPAMGSHGGGTAEGQTQVLAELDITQDAIDAPVVSNMEVVSLGRVESGAEVFFAKDALDADHVVVINRVKPHTAFRSEVESGLCKILAVGCGRQKGAANMHRYDLAKTIVPAARLIIQRASVLCGLAVTENALGETHSLKLARPEEFPDVDSEFLKTAWTLLPKLPVDDLDILLVDEMGKNVSGAGMDPNVIGFWRREGGERKPDYRILVVLDLTPHSHGNATGIGMADLTTRRVADQIDWEAELAVVIGKAGKRIPASKALDYVAGFSVMNDVSGRQAQFSDGQWFRGKSFDTFAPMGPALVTIDEIENLQNLNVTARVNGMVMQDGNSADMLFDIPTIIAFISQDITLMPGDIISTGTPSGVGIFRDPPVVLQPGNVVECRIENIGSIVNPVVAG